MVLRVRQEYPVQQAYRALRDPPVHQALPDRQVQQVLRAHLEYRDRQVLQEQ